MINNSAEHVHLVPRPAEQPSDDVVSDINLDVMQQVRQALEEARMAGQPVPGRPTLVRMTGATEHAIRKALAELARQAGERGDRQGLRISDAEVRPLSEQADEDAGPPADAETRVQFGRIGAAGGGVASVAGASAVPPPSGGRLVAWTGFVFGSVMSIAANVLHAWLPAGHEPPGWSPGIAPQVGAAVWPIGLMLAVEALSRIRWPGGLGWGLARFGGAGAVAAGSAIISYGHLRDVLLAWSYGPMAAAVGPLVLDGLMVVCGFALLAMSRTSTGEAVGGRW